LLFHDLTDLEMADFNYQNAIFGLQVDPDDANEPALPRRLNVAFTPAFRITAGFRCNRVEVLDVEPFETTPTT
jgi:hypothetical protein